MKLNKIKFIFFIASMAGGGFLAKKIVRCKQMFESFRGDKELAGSAAQELKELFEEWVKSMETSVLEFVKGKKKVNPQNIADHLDISLESSVFLINKLTRQGKLKIGSIEAIE